MVGKTEWTIQNLEQQLLDATRAIAAGGDDANVKALERARRKLERRLEDLRVQKALELPAPLRIVHDSPSDDSDDRVRIPWAAPAFDSITTRVSETLKARKVDLFEWARGLVEIDNDGGVREVGPVRMRDLIAGHCVFVSGGALKQVPTVVANTLCARPRPGLRPLNAVLRTPTLRPDGSILETPGYDEATGLFYLPDAVKYRKLTQKPTEAQAREAIAFLQKPIADFPFIEPAHRAAAVCFLMTTLLRPSIDGACPGFGFDAPSPGTGKTLLARIGGLIARGDDPPIQAYPEEEEEQEKRVTATLLAGTPLVIWDNITDAFGSYITDMLLTGRKFQGRILGTMDMPVLLNNTVWSFNGNNLRLANPDSIRRLIWIRMEYPRGNPTERTGFTIGPPHILRKWILAHRETLVRACLTIARWGALNPPTTPLRPFASFEEWSTLVRQPVVQLLEADPLDGFPLDDPGIHEESSTLANLYAGWLDAKTRLAMVDMRWTASVIAQQEEVISIVSSLHTKADQRVRALGILLHKVKRRPVAIFDDSGQSLGSYRCINGKRCRQGVTYDLERAE